MKIYLCKKCNNIITKRNDNGIMFKYQHPKKDINDPSCFNCKVVKINIRSRIYNEEDFYSFMKKHYLPIISNHAKLLFKQ